MEKKCLKCWESFDTKENKYRLCIDCYNTHIKNRKKNWTTDYHDLITIDTKKEDRGKMNIWDIYSNSIKCKLCDDTIRSRNRHDMVYCKCRSCAVDWGSWYNKILFNDIEDIEDLVVMFKDV